MTNQSLGARLRLARTKKGLTQEELAARCGTSQDVIQKIENGKSKRPRIIEKLAKELDVSPAWLQFGYEELDRLDRESIELMLEFNKLNPLQKKVIEAAVRSFRGTPDPS